MASYVFRYADMFGGAVRTTSMQCETDGEAIAKARETMRDAYAVLEITSGERAVYCAQATRRSRTG